MATIRPISDLRNKTHAVSALCHATDEPVFITKNGEGDLVIMSVEAYRRQEARLALYDALDVAEQSHRAGDKGMSLKALRKRLGR